MNKKYHNPALIFNNGHIYWLSVYLYIFGTGFYFNTKKYRSTILSVLNTKCCIAHTTLHTTILDSKTTKLKLNENINSWNQHRDYLLKPDQLI